MQTLLYILAPFLLLLSPNYEKIFNQGYQDALHYIEREAAFIYQVFPDEQERTMAVTIVFPELVRYSFLEDYFQETVNRVLYVSKGEGGADFSVGRLQMKPSFIEKLETYIREKPLVSFQRLALYSTTDEQAIRKERMRRLHSTEWQWLYLKAFLHIAEERFGDRDFSRYDQKIRFFATLYNHDFLAGAEQVEAWSRVAAYPYGLKSNQNQYNYAQVALYFYWKDWQDVARLFP